MRPYKIEVFEDSLYASTYLKHDVIRMNKFGKGNITHLVRGLTRVSDLLILQENKHPKMNNTCDNFCDSTEFCLLTPNGATCICADGFVKNMLVSVFPWSPKFNSIRTRINTYYLTGLQSQVRSSTTLYDGMRQRLVSKH